VHKYTENINKNALLAQRNILWLYRRNGASGTSAKKQAGKADLGV